MPAPSIYSQITNRDIQARFYAALEAELGAGFEGMVGREFRSNQKIETYPWLSNSPAMREWIGGRVIKQLRENSLTVENKKFEATLGFSIDDLNRDKTDVVQTRIEDLATRARQHDRKLLSTFIDNGNGTTSGAAWDGVSFFNSSHTIKGTQGNSTTIDNDIDSDISAHPTEVHGAIPSVGTPSVGEVAYSIMDGVKQIVDFKDEEGEPANGEASQFFVMAPIDFMVPFQQALSDARLGGDVSNPVVRGSFRITGMVNPRLTATDTFYVFRVDSPLRALILQVEEGPTSSMLGPQSEHAEKNDEALFMVRKRGNVGYGDFSKACRVTMV